MPASAAAAACSPASREQWERTFNICWGGVYLGVRTFLPLLLKADEAHIVNTSSVNGFWASVGLGVPHTAYSAAKFAVKGFTEALITDLAPQRAAHQMLGRDARPYRHLDRLQFAQDPERQRIRTLSPNELLATRQRLTGMGIDISPMSDDDIQKVAHDRARAASATTRRPSAAQAAKIILDGVKAERWRILVGDDAHKLDERVRQTPEQAYDAGVLPELCQGSRLAHRLIAVHRFVGADSAQTLRVRRRENPHTFRIMLIAQAGGSPYPPPDHALALRARER